MITVAAMRITVPTSAAGRSRNQVILFTLLSSCAASTGLVHVVEDRLYALIADAGAVLNVAGALQVGQGRFHPVFEAGDLVFEIGQFVRVEDHVLLVVVLPHLPQPAPERVGLRRQGFPLHLSTCFPGACEARTRRAKALVRGASPRRALRRCASPAGSRRTWRRRPPRARGSSWPPPRSLRRRA